MTALSGFQSHFRANSACSARRASAIQKPLTNEVTLDKSTKQNSSIGCAIYARSASATKRQSGTQPIQEQIERCHGLVRKHAWTFDEQHVYSDEGVSGNSMNRPGFSALLETARSKEHPFDVVIFDSLDRLGRNLAPALELALLLRASGITIKFVTTLPSVVFW
jgi:Resolvase, N terminal domain